MSRRLVALVGVIASLLVAGPVLASHVEPQFVSAASSCGPLAPGTAELVIEVPQGLDEVVEDGDFSATVSLDGTVGNGSVSFANATLPVKAAFVAGVDGGNLYVYEEPVRADDGLVAPDGQPVKEVSLCYVTDEGGDGGGSDAEGDAGSGGPTGGAGEDAGATSEPVSPPATDVQPAHPSPLLPVLFVATGLGLISLGLVVAVPGRRARRR